MSKTVKPKCEICGTPLKCPECKKAKKVKTRATAAGNYSRTRKGIRPDLHPTYMFKSATEANFARLLRYFNLDWRYEERAFTFDGYRTRPHVYIMDFEVKDGNRMFPVGFYEVKGYMNSQSRQKLRRFKKHYPTEAGNTTLIIYNHNNKADIEFCTKLGYKMMFYDELLKAYSRDVLGWE
jgi:hypothetical protein